MARQRMGQHFLGDPAWQQRIYATLPRPDQETWLEIGAGHGEMTALLASKARRVVAIEGDAKLASALSERAAREWPNVEVVAGDVLRLDLAQRLGDGSRVYGNLPYYITSPILHRLFECADRLASIHIVIQLEVAERIAARPGSRDYGYLSVASQFYAKPEIGLRIPPGAFRPPPKVTSALVHLILPGERAAAGIANDQSFFDFVRKCFAMKRKTLRNNAVSMADASAIDDALRAYHVPLEARAEQLTIQQFAALYRELSQRKKLRMGK